MCKTLCPRCFEYRKNHIVKRKDEILTKGRLIKYDAVFTQCLECGCEFEVSGQLDANLEKIRAEVLKANAALNIMAESIVGRARAEIKNACGAPSSAVKQEVGRSILSNEITLPNIPHL